MARNLFPATGPLRGRVMVPGDKSISHRCVLLGALADGACRARGWLEADDTGRSLAAVRALGASATVRGGVLEVAPGRDFAAGGEVVIDCGNSGTTARLLLGLLAGRGATAMLDGDGSLRSRPMARVAGPLAELGARIAWLGAKDRLPARVSGTRLRGGRVRLPVASAQVKSALLLAGLAADGPVTLTKCGASRDHTERMLRLMGVRLESADDGDTLTVHPGARLRAFDLAVPGDPSSAAFLVAAALLVPGSEITVDNVLLNPTRTGFLRVLERMGADLTIAPAGGDAWEPVGSVTARYGPLRGCAIMADEVPSLIDELPVLAVVAARANGLTTIRGASELRVKETDRISAMSEALWALGVLVAEQPDGFAITGPCALRGPSSLCPDDPGALLATRGDHRVAMALAVAALVADSPLRLDDDACVVISFPDFFAALARLGAGDGGTEA